MTSAGDRDATADPCTKSVEGPGVVDLFLHAGPGSTRLDAQGQFVSMAARAFRALAERGLGPNNVVCGFIHFATAPSWNWREALLGEWQISGPLPITALLQPPAAPSCACTIQLHAVRSARQSGVWRGNEAQPAAATVLRSGARHLHLMSIVPRPELAANASVAALAYDMLAQAGHALTARGLRFSDVVRTWIHVRDIEHNHAAFNQARNRYYDEQHLPCLPASTCVEGRVLGAESPVAMDLYAVGKSPDVEVTAIAPGSMGEATAHGSAFTRGSLLHEPGRRWLYVSGMASLDARGDVVCPGDVQGQWRRIFDNAGALLDEAGMGLGDVVNAKAYLKHAADYDGFLQSAVSTGLSLDVPTAVVVADICRPQGLCELELCAVRAD